MSGDDLDARLRRVFAGNDAAPGFEARVLARVAALPAVPVADLRLRYERRQLEARERLRREAWLNTATAVGVGVAGIALVWRNATAVAEWVQSSLAVVGQSESFALAGVALLAAVIWPFLPRAGGAES